jgi:hypothetical protein
MAILATEWEWEWVLIARSIGVPRMAVLLFGSITH